MTNTDASQPRIDPALLAEIIPKLEDSYANYRGDATVLESAWGTIFMSLIYGWKVVYLMHSQATIRKYQDITGLVFREIAPESTVISRKSMAFKVVESGTNFWRVIRGQEPGIKTTQLKDST